MKTAYELAMERLDKEDPDAARPLSEEQKSELAAIDEKYRAQRAEREVFLRQQLDDARAKGDQQAVEQLERQLTDELARFEEDKEAEKDKVRNRTG
ncbi:MAG: hypothetical protein ACLFUF_06080 [Opitutales bacterium]